MNVSAQRLIWINSALALYDSRIILENKNEIRRAVGRAFCTLRAGDRSNHGMPVGPEGE
jgi:hypothetical protein